MVQDSDWDELTAPGGAMEPIMKAKQVGKTRFIGVTSHNLAMAVILVKTGLFSTIQFPFNFIEQRPKDELRTEAKKNEYGDPRHETVRRRDDRQRRTCIQAPATVPDFILLPGFDSVEHVDQVADFCKELVLFPRNLQGLVFNIDPEESAQPLIGP